MAHGDHLKYQAKPKAGRQTLFRLTSYLVCDRLLLSVIGVLIVLSIAANLGGFLSAPSDYQSLYYSRRFPGVG